MAAPFSPIMMGTCKAWRDVVLVSIIAHSWIMGVSWYERLVSGHGEKANEQKGQGWVERELKRSTERRQMSRAYN
jgi:hypothetical protein